MMARHPRARRALLAGGTAAALVLASSGAWALSQPTATSSLVLGAVTTGEVTETLSGSGTVATLEAQSVSFPASAEVTSVSATVGDTVTAGQELATIDTTALETALDEAALALAEAEQQLEEAEDSADEDSTSSTNSATSTTSSSGATSGAAQSTPSASAAPSASSAPSASTDPAAPTGDVGAPDTSAADLDAAKQRLTDARAAYSTAWMQLLSGMASAIAVCTTTPTAGVTATSASLTTEESAEPTPSATPSASVTSTPEATPSVTSTPEATEATEPTTEATDGEDGGSVDNSACITALEGLEPLEQAVTDAEAGVDDAVDAVVAWADQAVADSASATDQTDDGEQVGVATGDSGTSATGDSDTSATGDNANAATPGGSTTTGDAATSADTSSSGGATASESAGATQSGGAMGGSSMTVAQAEIAVTEAEVAYTSAELALDRATLVAPVDGVLTAMPFVVGQTASTSDVATVTAGDGVVIPIEVDVTDIPEVATGQAVTVTDATGLESTGEVSTIALLPTSSTSGSSTYTVTVAVTDPGPGLAVGTAANLLVTVASAGDAVLVPISAVTLTGSGTGTVRVIEDGEAVTRDVTLGIVGTTHVEVVDGLASGDEVVLSDASEAIPSSDDTTSTGALVGATGGGFPGAEMPAGGFPGGGMPQR